MTNVVRWRLVWVATAAWIGAACVGGGSAEPDGGAGVGGSGGNCVVCLPGCFDCGGGCQCVDGGIPNAMTWVSPFPETGEDGTWRDGTPRFCLGPNNLQALDVWSDARGVYALVGGGVLADPTGGDAAEPPSGGVSGGMAGAGGVGGFGTGGGAGIGGFGGVAGVGPNGCFNNDCFGEAVFFNDGVEGWQRIYEQQESANLEQRRLSGVPNGPLLVWGTVVRFQGTEACAFGQMDPSTGDWTCQRATGAPTAVFPVSETLAYAALGTDLIRFDGTAWTVYGPQAPVAISSLWANETDVAVVTSVGEIFLLRDDAWSPIGASGVAVWGNAADDLWFVTPFNMLAHYDGTAVTNAAEIAVPSCGQPPLIGGIWGSGDTLYIYGPRTLLRWNGSALDTLGEWTCDFNQSASVTRVWGNGPNEVFLAMWDFNRPFTDPACGNGIVMYFDGNEFHSL